MDLHEALDRVAQMQELVTRSATFRGYRALPVTISACTALAAAAAQPWLLPDPADQPRAFVSLWLVVAVIATLAHAVHFRLRWRQSPTSRENRLTIRALELLLPCIVGGGCLTLALTWFAPETTWLLPGLWAILLSQGVFASLPILPRSIAWVGYYYLAAGIGCLVLARGPWMYSPWTMAISFGGGQALAALILYMTLERADGRDA